MLVVMIMLKLYPDDSTLLDDPTQYQDVVAFLMYLTLTCPDIQFVVHVVSQFVVQSLFKFFNTCKAHLIMDYDSFHRHQLYVHFVMQTELEISQANIPKLVGVFIKKIL